MPALGKGGPKGNKFEQVSSIPYQMSLAGGVGVLVQNGAGSVPLQEEWGSLTEWGWEWSFTGGVGARVCVQRGSFGGQVQYIIDIDQMGTPPLVMTSGGYW